MLHQQEALNIAGVEWTRDPQADYDLLHLNTYGLKSLWIIHQAKHKGKKVIFHGHSTKEDFRNSFIGSNFIAPFFKLYLKHFYKRADLVITPTPYSAGLIKSYGITCPIIPISNGIDLKRYAKSEKKEAIFREKYDVKPGQKVVVCAALYFMRKGIDEFVQVAEKMPDVRFIWFGATTLWTVPPKVQRIVKTAHPANVLFPGYVKGDAFEGALSGADAFFFPSREETEGIVVLEALASHQKVLVRDIPVYKGWLDESAASFGSSVDDFVRELRLILDGEVDKTAAGYQIAQSRAIEAIADQLVNAYKETLAL